MYDNDEYVTNALAVGAYVALPAIIAGQIADQSRGKSTPSIWAIAREIVTTRSPKYYIPRSTINYIIDELEAINTPASMAMIGVLGSVS